MTIRDFLDKNPSLVEIKDFVEFEAEKIVSELKAKEETDSCGGQEVKT